MKNWLESIETEYGLKILFSCEAGSRAWGIEGNDSDFDVRFIYRYQDLKKYLSLNPAPSALSFQFPFDGSGFDVFKAFDLILKSNPSIYEWAYSPHIYLADDHFLQKLKRVIETSYSPLSLYKHYGSLIKRNMKEAVIEGYSPKKQKQLIQAIRAEIIRSGIRETNVICSPFVYLTKAGETHPQLISAYCQLTEAKKKHNLLDREVVKRIIDLLEICSEQAKDFSVPVKKPCVDFMNEWIWETLGL